MYQTTLEVEYQFLGVSVRTILVNSVGHVLFCDIILQFKGGDGKPIDKHYKVKCQVRVLLAIAHLTGHAEDIPFVSLNGFLVFLRRQTII